MKSLKEKSVEQLFITENDTWLFHEGTNYQIYRKIGAHPSVKDGHSGTFFSLWAPNALEVSVLTGANGWDTEKGKMQRSPDSFWEKFVPEAKKGDVYRFAVRGADGVLRYKSDPLAFYTELRPNNASKIWDLSDYDWQDFQWMAARNHDNVLEKAMAVYEVHLGSWKKDCSKGEDGFMNYREYAEQLTEYLQYMGYTHVELMGICEYPFDLSWGYQVTGYFAPTSRYGNPDDFRYFIDRMHQAGIGVILDWVPAHFPKDSFALEHFDGTCLYEWEDPLRAEYPEWGTLAFDHSKPEIRSFLISSAFYWIQEFHIDALRVDAVAAMFYNSFSRENWRPNRFGGSENLESTAFLKQLNQAVTENTSGYLIAEDSSIIKGVTAPVEKGGVGFKLKWNMGWMNDTLKYFKEDPVFRRYHHDKIIHSIDYAFQENYVLPLSHDEVVYGKRSMVEKNPGSLMDQFGGLKVLYTYQFTHPGKKLLFMGQDFAQNQEWDVKKDLDWHLAEEPGHRDVMQCVRKLLDIYRKYPVLYTDSGNPVTFEWVNSQDADRNIISYIRRNPWNYKDALLVICNFSSVFRYSFLCGVPLKGYYKRVFSTYDALPGGGGEAELGNLPPLTAEEGGCDGYTYLIRYDLRPFEAVIFEFPMG